MAESLGAAVLTVSVDDRQFQAGLNSAQAKAGAASQQITRSFDGIGASLRNLAGIAGIAGIGALAQQIAATGQQSERSKIQLQALAGAYGEAGAAAQSVARIQQVLGISALDARKGYANLFATLRGTGLGVKELEVLFVGVSKAATLSGASLQEAQSGLLQLKQGLAAGTFQGDELRSVLENIPVLAQAIAGQLGVSVGAVKQLGSEGKITADVVFNAAKQLASSTVPAKTQVEQLAVAYTNLKETAAEAFGPALVGAIKGITAGLVAFKDFVSQNKEELILFGRSVVAIAKAFAPLIIGITAVRAAFGAYAAAVNAVRLAQAGLLALSGPKGWLALAAGVAATAAAAKLLDNSFKGAGQASKKAQEEAKKAADQFANVLAGTSLSPSDDGLKPLADKAKEVGKILKDSATESAQILTEAFNRISEARGVLANLQASPDKGINQFLSPEQRQLRLNTAIGTRGQDLERAISIGSTILKEQGISFNKSLIEELRGIIRGAAGQRSVVGSVNGVPITGVNGPPGSQEGFRRIDDFINAVFQENQAKVDLNTATQNLVNINGELSTINADLASQVKELAQKDWQVYVTVPGAQVAGDVVGAVTGLL